MTMGTNMKTTMTMAKSKTTEDDDGYDDDNGDESVDNGYDDDNDDRTKPMM